MKSIFAASVVVSLALALSRLSGFVREVLLAARLGSSEVADGAILILTLPDFMVGLLLTGGINAALIPVLKELNGAERSQFLLRVFACVFCVFFVLSGVFIIGITQIVGLLAPELNMDELPDFQLAFSLSMLALPIAGLIGVSGSYLTTIGKFSIPGLSVLAFNCVLSSYIASRLPNGNALAGLGVVILCAALLRLGLHLYPMRSVIFRKAVLSSSGKFVVRKTDGFALRFVQGIGAFSIMVGVPFIFRSLHATNGDGYLTLFNYGQKLYELPAAMLVAPVVVVLLPKLSAMVSQGDEALYTYVKRGLMAVLALSGIALGVGYLFMGTIVQLAFGYGAISEQDLADIAAITRLMLLAIPFYAISQISAITLNAMKRTNVLLALSAISLLTALGHYMALANLVTGEQRAPVSFVIFFAVFGLSSTMVVLPIRVWTFDAVKSVVFLVSRLILSLGAFAIFLQLYEPRSFWEEMGFMIFATLFSVVMVFPHLKVLIHMKVDTN